MKRYTLAAVAALLVFVSGHAALRAAAPPYTVVNLGTFNGQVPTITGVSASGQVVGNVGTNGSMAVRYTSGVGWESLPGLDTTYSFAAGINAAGDVVGYHIAGDTVRAFRFRNNVVEDIQPLADGTTTFGLAINDDSVVTGWSDSSAGIVPIVAAGTVSTRLPDLGGGMAWGCAINANGQVAGISMTAAGPQHGIRIDPGAITALDIASLDGSSFNVTTCAIDATGNLGGQMDRTGNKSHALRYSDGTGVVDLDVFGSTASKIESIAAGVGVGWYTLSDGVTTRAFAYTDAAGSFDLNTRIDAAGWTLATARAINKNGVIAGEGRFNGADTTYLMTPPQASDTTPPVINGVTADPASIFPPKGQMVPVTVTVDAKDDSGQAPACTLTSISAPGASANDVSISGPLAGAVRAVGGRTYTLNVTCTDGANNSASASGNVTVVADTTAPVISSVTAKPNNLWPPDNRMAPVTVSVGATDDVDDAPVCSVTSVGGVQASDDASITGPLAVSLRAAGGRLYVLNVRCADQAGNASTSSTNVVVPPDTTAPTFTTLSASPDSLWPPDGRLASIVVTAAATDDVDPHPSCALVSITGFSGPAGDAVVNGPSSATLRAVGGRTYSLNVRCADSTGNAATSSVSVVVPPDVTPPTITALSATPSLVWPANNKMVGVTVSVSATDDVDVAPVCSLTSVTGGPATDVVMTGAFSANVRASKNADGSARTYLFNVSCRDKAGNASLAAVSVSVSKDMPSQIYHYNHKLRRFLLGLPRAYGRDRR